MAEVKGCLAFYGTVVNTVSATQPMVILEKAVIIIKDSRIVALQSDINEDEAKKVVENHQFPVGCLRILKYGEFLMPGMVDTHIHASQYVNVGIGYDMTLLDWLDKHTFPTEARFENLDFAHDVYSKVVRRTLKNGTTTASYFATIHVKASLLLAELMQRYGQRGYVGKVCMDTDSPPYYIETTEESISATRNFIKLMQAQYGVGGFIQPCVTPRFAVSCSMELMTGLAELAQEFDTPIQTHMSENCDEIALVKEKFNVSEYVEVYENAGLMTDKMILAHCIYSNHSELATIKKYESGIAHCPNSNTSITSGEMNSRMILDKDIKLGLGTDVSGGYSSSVLDSIRQAVAVSRHVYFHKPDQVESLLDHKEAFYLATLGGAKVLHLDDRIGNFEVGKEFDALVVNTAVADGPFDLLEESAPNELVQKFLYCGDDRNITDVYVAAQKIDFSA